MRPALKDLKKLNLIVLSVSETPGQRVQEMNCCQRQQVGVGGLIVEDVVWSFVLVLRPKSKREKRARKLALSCRKQCEDVQFRKNVFVQKFLEQSTSLREK